MSVNQPVTYHWKVGSRPAHQHSNIVTISGAFQQPKFTLSLHIVTWTQPTQSWVISWARWHSISIKTLSTNRFSPSHLQMVSGLEREESANIISQCCSTNVITAQLCPPLSCLFPVPGLFNSYYTVYISALQRTIRATELLWSMLLVVNAPCGQLYYCSCWTL